MPERRDPRRPQPPIDRPVFHFDTGLAADHDDGHDDRHADEDHGDEGHDDSAAGDDWLLDRLQSLIRTVQQDLLTRQQRLERLVGERLTAVENEAARVVRELGEHVHELGRRVDDATGDELPSGRPAPRDPRG